MDSYRTIRAIHSSLQIINITTTVKEAMVSLQRQYTMIGTVNQAIVQLTVTYRLTDSRQGLTSGIEIIGTKR